jgi:hypothetical protein
VPGGLVGICRSISVQSGTNLVLLATLLLKLIEPFVEWQHEMGAIGDAHTRDIDAAVLKSTQLCDQGGKLDHNPGADHALNMRVEDARWHEPKLERAAVCLYGMTGVTPTVGSHDHGGIGGKRIGELALALVAPLTTHDDCCWHDSEFSCVSLC